MLRQVGFTLMVAEALIKSGLSKKEALVPLLAIAGGIIGGEKVKDPEGAEAARAEAIQMLNYGIEAGERADRS